MKTRLILMVFLPLLLMASTFGIHLIEYRLMGNPEYANLFDCLYWTVVTITTVGFGDIFPVSIYGRIFTLFVIPGGVVLYSLIISMFTSAFTQYHSRRERGLDPAGMSDHILICSDDPEWVMDILVQTGNFSDNERVVLIAPFEVHPLLTTPFKNLKWISGDGYRLEILKKASAEKARIAYVSYRENSCTLMTVLQLETMSGGKVITLAQYIGQEHRKYFEDVGCDYALDPYELYVPLMMMAYRFQGAPSWIRLVVHHRLGNQVHTRRIELEYVGRTWLDYVREMKSSKGFMPLAVSIDEVVLINPDSDYELQQESSVLRIEPKEPKSLGDREENGVPVLGMEELPIEGHLLISSDNQVFIERLLVEMSRCTLSEPVKVLSEIQPIETCPENLDIEWIQGPSNAEESFRKANAKEAKVAFIDHRHDGQNLMAVLRLEEESDGEVFSISTYHEKDFDQQLHKVGCDFSLQVDDLVAPLLSQSAYNSGLGTMVEKFLSQDAETQKLFVRKLKHDREPKDWLSTLVEIKKLAEVLPVGLICSRTGEMIANPHPGIEVQPGDNLVFIGLESFVKAEEIFEMEDVISISEEIEGDKTSDGEEQPRVEAEGDKLFRKGLEISKDGGDMLEAYRCFHQAAILGHGLAKYNLGIMNFNGQGVPKNRNEAYHWFRQSARTGNEGAKKVLRSIRVLRQMDKYNAETVMEASNSITSFWRIWMRTIDTGMPRPSLPW